MEPKLFKSVLELIAAIKEDYNNWQTPVPPWFRGEPISGSPLTPKLYRTPGKYDENTLLQRFRQQAPVFTGNYTPPRGDTDQWLFLAQHVGLPTRLLDWSLGALIALYFAAKKEEPACLWMLNSFELNRLSLTDKKQVLPPHVYSLTWHDAMPPLVNLGKVNIDSAWQNDDGEFALPTAVLPTYFHPRMTAQKSCFTIQGKWKMSLEDCVNAKHQTDLKSSNAIWPFLKKYPLDQNKHKEILKDLMLLGISQSTLFPEPDGLAKELEMLMEF